MTTVRTRHTSQSALSQDLGSGEPLLGNELPTMRGILRLGILIQEENLLLCDVEKKHYPIDELVKEMTTALLKQWEKANISFSPPITISEKGVQSRLKRAWETVQKIVWKRKIKEDNVREFESKHDKLIDITKYKCEIKSCNSFGCNGCELKS